MVQSGMDIERLPMTANTMGGDRVKSGKASGGNGNQLNILNISAETPANTVMCWKDPTKVCKCERPQRGVYCGRVPLPTD